MIFTDGVYLTEVQVNILDLLRSKQGEVANIRIDSRTKRRFIVEGWIIPVRDRGVTITVAGLAMLAKVENRRQYRKDGMCRDCEVVERCGKNCSYCQRCKNTRNKIARIKRHIKSKGQADARTSASLS